MKCRPQGDVSWKRLCVDKVQWYGRMPPGARFWKDVLPTDRKPIEVRLNIPQFPVIGRSGMVGIGVGGLEHADALFSVSGDDKVLFKRLRLDPVGRCNLIDFGLVELHEHNA